MMMNDYDVDENENDDNDHDDKSQQTFRQSQSTHLIL